MGNDLCICCGQKQQIMGIGILEVSSTERIIPNSATLGSLYPMNPTDNTKFPTRWQYPQNELDYNTENVREAVQRQYNGSDDFNGIMWILHD